MFAILRNCNNKLFGNHVIILYLKLPDIILTKINFMNLVVETKFLINFLSNSCTAFIPKKTFILNDFNGFNPKHFPNIFWKKPVLSSKDPAEDKRRPLEEGCRFNDSGFDCLGGVWFFSTNEVSPLSSLFLIL